MATRAEVPRSEYRNECGNLMLGNQFNMGAGGQINMNGKSFKFFYAEGWQEADMVVHNRKSRLY